MRQLLPQSMPVHHARSPHSIAYSLRPTNPSSPQYLVSFCGTVQWARWESTFYTEYAKIIYLGMLIPTHQVTQSYTRIQLELSQLWNCQILYIISCCRSTKAKSCTDLIQGTGAEEWHAGVQACSTETCSSYELSTAAHYQEWSLSTRMEWESYYVERYSVSCIRNFSRDQWKRETSERVM